MNLTLCYSRRHFLNALMVFLFDPLNALRAWYQSGNRPQAFKRWVI